VQLPCQVCVGTTTWRGERPILEVHTESLVVLKSSSLASRTGGGSRSLGSRNAPQETDLRGPNHGLFTRVYKATLSFSTGRDVSEPLCHGVD